MAKEVAHGVQRQAFLPGRLSRQNGFDCQLS
jgi:hypothetical protein